MKKENWELTMAFEAVEELEEAERKVILTEQMVQAYYDSKLNRAQKRIANLEIKRCRRMLGHK